MKRTLNIDTELVKRYRFTKRNKELLALAIWCHIKRVNAVIFNFDRKMLRKELGIGDAKARRLIADAEEDSLFTFHDGYVSVGSFRNKDIKRTKHGKEYTSAVVKKIEFDTEDENGKEKQFKLKELYELVNEILVTFTIAAQERDRFLQGDYTNCNDQVSDARSRKLTLKKLSLSTKMSVSSTYRIMSRLVGSGKLNKKPAIIFSIIGSEHEKQIRESLNVLGRMTYTFQHNSLTYIIVPCSYSIADRKISDSFRHKIYGYWGYNSGERNQDIKSTIPQLCGC